MATSNNRGEVGDLLDRMTLGVVKTLGTFEFENIMHLEDVTGILGKSYQSSYASMQNVHHTTWSRLLSGKSI